MAKKPPPKKTFTWEITLIRERGRFLGYVDAPDEKTAIKIAIEQFQITNLEQQKRLIVRRGTKRASIGGRSAKRS
jgi:hypothetical protein